MGIKFFKFFTKRTLTLICSVLWIWTCGGDGPTEPKIELPTVQNIEFTLEEDTSKTFAFMGSDPLNRALTYSVSTQPQHGTLTINAGAGTYTPYANYHGADTFAYIATNVDGTSNIGTIVATVTPVDDEPNSMDVSATTDEDNAIEITLQAEEVDGDNIEFQVRNNPSNGSVSISETTATYTPNENWNGTDTFNFEAVDSNARSVLNVATATIIVNPVNDAPVAEDIDAGAIKVNESKDITLVGSDVENDNLTYTIVSQPSKGTVTINGAIATYTASIMGEDTFTYQVNDGKDNSEDGNVNIDNTSFVTFGSQAFDEANDVIESSSGGYVLVGSTRISSSNLLDGYLIKTNEDGIMEWSQVIRNSSSLADDQIYELQQTFDGGFILFGYTGVQGLDSQMFLIKTDESGIEEWKKHYGGNDFERAYSGDQTSDGGFILGGLQYINGNSDMYLVKTDASGVEEWTKTFGEPFKYERIYSVKQTLDGGYVIGGVSGASGYESYIIKTDESGNEEWSRKFSKIGNSSINDIQQTSDGGFIIAACTSDCNKISLVKIDASGNEEWESIFEGYYYSKGHKVQQTTDGGFIIVGNTTPFNSFNDEGADFYLVKTDAGGTEEWSNTYGSDKFDEAFSVKQTSDGGFILVGSTLKNGESDIYLVKTDSDGNQEW